MDDLFTSNEKETLKEKLLLLENRIVDRDKVQTKDKADVERIRGLLGYSDNVADSATLTGIRLTDIAEQILLELPYGTEMNYRRLAEEVEKRGGVVNGKSKNDTFNAHISRDKRFCRPNRKGYYALRAHYPDANNVGERQKSTRNGEKPNESPQPDQ